jgi:hypothetical protein
MEKRIEGGSVIAAIGAVMLLTSLFLDWFEPDLSAWTAFEIVDLLLAGLALAVIYACVEQLRDADAASAGQPAARWPALAGVLALVLVVATLLNHPPAAIGLGVKVGIWIALAGAVLMALGTLIDRSGISFSFSVARSTPRTAGPGDRDAGAAPEPPGSDTETRPISSG